MDLFSVGFCCSDEDSIKTNYSEKCLVLNGELETVFAEDQFSLASTELFNFTVDEDFLLEEDNWTVLSNIGE